jgi:hypothetical protein
MPRGKPDERVQLLFGPYRPPKFRAGDRTVCLFRDCDVVVTSWTDAPISWPRCRTLGTRSRPGLLVDEELARALRNESALAIRYWWGADPTTVWRWRKALGVGPRDPEGSRRLCQAVAEAAAEKCRGKKLPPEQVERRRRTARELDLAQYLPKGYHGPWWTVEETALLGTASDEDVARRIGRSADAVRCRRNRHGIPHPRDRRRREHGGKGLRAAARPPQPTAARCDETSCPARG